MEAALARRPRRQPLLLGPFKGAIEGGLGLGYPKMQYENSF